ncbi:tRNA (adenosine(37)-N6)-dimethylallyltransferase MiaA [Fructilactobacillus florum]|uniref:tRNA dimethylallyltransferase n=1 Tax=Fructilactobacillus florum DSM 22689 = JCM 16035 TaxID=1423745 RepID=A0A0R2CJL8_9LACO|nr:tRNA (adenosine(37)-N6)-dimethylallyltransferase MiaA [Fructilactobacillus florum]EKK20710.1 tRNA delta(2)-isopentenylpyrophosphate transferase [Fructilactobacillus florum 2F]KRM91806.1 tRNA Delta(2)-isopentenylpyrophosphate transferase [Fructilactobacillus florum DSM 22689 = JCM 16035]
MTIKVLAIVGPTAVGKSDLAVHLAQKYQGEIISGDSMQVYRHLDVGTAKIPPSKRQGVPHHLIDIINVDQQYSVTQFVTAARRLITEIHERHRLPIIAGGTGYYLQALLDGLAFGGEQSTDRRVQQQLLERSQTQGLQSLWDELYQIDPLTAQKIAPTNQRRLFRALEIWNTTHKRPSEQVNHGSAYDAGLVGLTGDRSKLYQRINQRVEVMMQQGLLAENQWLQEQGGSSLPASHGIGYHEFEAYFKRQQSLPATVEQIKKDTRHYAKRQLTWYRNKMNVHWFQLYEQPEQLAKIESLITDWSF